MLSLQTSVGAVFVCRGGFCTITQKKKKIIIKFVELHNNNNLQIGLNLFFRCYKINNRKILKMFDIKKTIFVFFFFFIFFLDIFQIFHSEKG